MRKISLLFIFFVLFISCRTVTLEKRLDPQSEEFLSITQYIISDSERKVFLELPPWEREKFIEDFWKRRDPIPQTDINEFKELYMKRIETANKLFSKGKKGYLTDRGRIYVLFGPPDELIKSEGGQYIDPFSDARAVQLPTREGSKPMETWIYRNILSAMQERIYVRLDFADVDGTGDYKLITDLREAVPGTVSTVLNPNLTLLHELNKEEFFRKREQGEKPIFDFNCQFKKVKAKDSNLIIHMEIPIKSVYLEEEDNFLKADLRTIVRIMELNGQVLWEFEKEYYFSTSKSDVIEGRAKNWIIDIPVHIILPKGSHNAYICISNLSAKEEIKKLLPFKI
ncbi:MAG: GWxTD domain-containing protein [Candidatus Aminicenantia bacterium]